VISVVHQLAFDVPSISAREEQGHKHDVRFVGGQKPDLLDYQHTSTL